LQSTSESARIMVAPILFFEECLRFSGWRLQA
jgi:hypothetical protein